MPQAAGAPPPALTPVSWKNPASGDWNTASRWNTGLVPSASSSVTIAAPGSYTVTVADPAAAGAITVSDAAATLAIGADLTLGGTLAVTAGTLSLVQGGTITGGTLLANAGGTLILDTGGTLDNVAVRGTLTLATQGGTLTLGEGLAAGSAAAIEVTGAYDRLDFAASASLRNTSITLDTANAQSFITLEDTSTATQTFTIGASSAIAATAGADFLSSAVYSGNGGNLTLINHGTLSASVTSTSLNVYTSAGPIRNAGLISVTGGATLLLDSTTVSNVGTIAVSGPGSTLYYDYGLEDDPASTWTNAGKINVSAGGTVLLFGTGNLAGLANIASQGGTIQIEGTVTGPGTLTVQPASAGSLILSGQIAGATIVDPDGLLAFSQGSRNLYNDHYWGTLDVDTAGLTIDNVAFAGASGTGQGAILLDGENAVLNDYGALNNAILSAGGGASLNFAFGASAPFTTTLGPQFAIVDAGGGVDMTDDGIGCTIDNQGAILANHAGGRITFSELDGSTGEGSSFFINSGTIAVSNADRFDVLGGNNNDKLTNAGLISASSGGTISFVQNAVVNSGMVTAAGQSTSVTLGTQPSNTSTVAAVWTNSGTIAVSGDASMYLLGGVNNQGQISETSGSLSFASAVTNGGTIQASGGSVIFGKALLGNGVVDISAGASVQLSLAGQGNIHFLAGGGTLATSHAALLSAVIGGFAAQDSIDLLNTASTGFTYSAGTLSVFDGASTVAELHFSGNYSSASFSLTSDGHHGTSISFV